MSHYPGFLSRDGGVVVEPWQVRWLLAHINDNAALAEATIAEQLAVKANVGPQGRDSRMRSIVLEWLEFLSRPAPQRSTRSWRRTLV